MTDYATSLISYGSVHFAEIDQEEEFIISASRDKVTDWCEGIRDMLLTAEWNMKDIRNVIRSDLDIDYLFR